MRYLTIFVLSTARWRKWIPADLMADRDSVAEVRAFPTGHSLAREDDRLAVRERDIRVSRSAATPS
jgi:hypothetical protein